MAREPLLSRPCAVAGEEAEELRGAGGKDRYAGRYREGGRGQRLANTPE